MTRFNKGDIVTGAPGKGGHGQRFTFDCYDSSIGSGPDAWIFNEKNERVQCDTMGMVLYDPSHLAFVKINLTVDRSGPHNCADHMEFCQGFRFDYHFCKVCGTKQNAA